MTVSHNAQQDLATTMAVALYVQVIDFIDMPERSPLSSQRKLTSSLATWPKGSKPA